MDNISKVAHIDQNNKGPRIEPCGTALLYFKSERTPPKCTYFLLSFFYVFLQKFICTLSNSIQLKFTE